MHENPVTRLVTLSRFHGKGMAPHRHISIDDLLPGVWHRFYGVPDVSMKDMRYEDLQYGKEVQLMRDLYYRFMNESSAMMLTIKSRNL